MNERDSSIGWCSKELGGTKEDDQLSRQPGSESFVFERNVRSSVQVFLCHSSLPRNDSETVMFQEKCLRNESLLLPFTFWENDTRFCNISRPDRAGDFFDKLFI